MRGRSGYPGMHRCDAVGLAEVALVTSKTEASLLTSVEQRRCSEAPGGTTESSGLADLSASKSSSLGDPSVDGLVGWLAGKPFGAAARMEPRRHGDTSGEASSRARVRAGPHPVAATQAASGALLCEPSGTGTPPFTGSVPLGRQRCRSRTPPGGLTDRALGPSRHCEGPDSS